MIPRIIQSHIQGDFFKGKIIHIPGARQVGKTTLMDKISAEISAKIIWLNGDEPDVRQMFHQATSTQLGNMIGDRRVVIVDEAQRIENIGISLKLLVDNFPDKQIIATGSSAFDLANKINEPLTGRKIEYQLFPICFAEMVNHHGLIQEKRLLENRLIYGYYPEVVTSPGNETEVLKRLSDAYLYKDIFLLENIKKPVLIEKLIQALALQTGNEISANELGQIIGADAKTVEKYIDLLEKAYIIFKLPSYSRNLRNEIKKGRKIYFYDNGIRNAVIRNFNHVNLRQDIGALWENFLVSERVKSTSYQKLWLNRYFWRTHTQQEIDYIEEYGGKLYAFEFKWRSKKKAKFPRSFVESYPESSTEIIDKENYPEFLL
ncbi:MAG: ATP-binding protein [Candidatus Cyclobacteriaceae bacterium M3_2C_046]